LNAKLPHPINPKMKICLLGDEPQLFQQTVVDGNCDVYTTQLLWGFGRDKKMIKRFENSITKKKILRRTLTFFFRFRKQKDGLKNMMPLLQVM